MSPRRISAGQFTSWLTATVGTSRLPTWLTALVTTGLTAIRLILFLLTVTSVAGLIPSGLIPTCLAIAGTTGLDTILSVRLVTAVGLAVSAIAGLGNTVRCP